MTLKKEATINSVKSIIGKSPGGIPLVPYSHCVIHTKVKAPASSGCVVIGAA